MEAGGSQIWVIDDEGNRQAFSSADEGWAIERMAWNADGTLLAVDAFLFEGECTIAGRILLLDADGRIVGRSVPPAGSFDGHPTWYGGSGLAFIRATLPCGPEEEGRTELYASGDNLSASAVDGIATARRVATDVDMAAGTPVLGSSVIAFIRFNSAPSGPSREAIGPEIWTVQADGSDEKLLGGRLEDGSRERLWDTLAWSPDGSALAYIRQSGTELDTAQIALMSAGITYAGGTITPLTPVAGGYVEHVDWLPDGTGLVYVEQRSLYTAVVVQSPDGIELARFVQTDGVPQIPLAIAPDGSRVAWRIQGTGDLWIQPLSGGEARTFPIGSAPRGSILIWQP